MQAKMDHVVLWVSDPLRSLDFYERVVGLTPVRADEFRAGKAPFPSVRVSMDTVIDLVNRAAAPILDAVVGVPGNAGSAVNQGGHPCALLDNAQVKCWGYNAGGQLGLGDLENRDDGPVEMGDSLPAVNLGADLGATAIAGGGLHTCALLDSGQLKCWL